MSDKKQPDKILDFEYTQKDKQSEGPSEKVLWEGTPCLQVLMDHPQMDKGRNLRYFYSLVVFMLPLIAGVLVYWTTGSILGTVFILIMTVSFIIAFIPPYFLFNRYLKYNKTKYYITRAAIHFDLDDGYRTVKEQLNWDQIRSIRHSAQPEGLTAIHFLTKEETSFRSYNFIDKETRQFPSFELLEDGEKTLKLLQNLLRSKKGEA